MAEAKIDIILTNGAKAGATFGALQKQAAKLYAELKKLAPGTEEFAKKVTELQGVRAELEEINKVIKGTTEASDDLNASFELFIPFSGKFKEIGESISVVYKGVGGLSSQFGVLRGAIISTGIGALVVILGSLISYFSSTQEGIDKLTAVTRPLQAVFQVLMKMFGELGGKIFARLEEAINKPKQAFIDLGKVLWENVINRFKALGLLWPAIKKLFAGDISGGFKDLANATIQATTGVTNAIDKLQAVGKAVAEVVDDAIEKGKLLDKLQKEIELAEIAQIKRAKQLDLVIKQQKAIVEDQTKSWDERREAAKKALAAQEILLNTELSLMDKKIQKMKVEMSLQGVTREAQRELAELEAKRLETEAQITEQRIEFRNKIIEFDKAQRAEEIAALRSLQDIRLEAMQEGSEKEIAQIKLDTERKIEALQGSYDQLIESELLLVDLKNQRIQEAEDRAEEEKRAKEYEKAIADHEYQLARDLNFLNERKLSQIITEEQYTTQAEQLAIDAEKRRLDIIRESHGVFTIEYQEAYASYLSLQQAASDRAVAIKQKEIQQIKAAMLGSLGTFGDFFGSIASMQKEGTEAWKGFATAQAIMSTIQSSINAYQSTAAIPIIGPALAPVAAGLALAAGMANVKKIQNTKVDAPVGKAEKGMILKGPSHAQGGIHIEAEGDEIILAKGVYRNPRLRRMASDLNVAGGGRKFAAGGPVSPYASLPSGSPVTTTSPGQQEGNDFRQWGERLIESVDRRFDRIKVVNVATETEDVLKTVNAIKDDADV